MKEGDIFKVDAPFIKMETFDRVNNGGAKKYYWQHGIKFEEPEYDGTRSIPYVEHEGFAEYKIIKIVEMPKPYHNRIMYRKRLTDPEGKVLKWQPLLMVGPKGFETLKNGKWDYEVI